MKGFKINSFINHRLLSSSSSNTYSYLTFIIIPRFFNFVINVVPENATFIREYNNIRPLYCLIIQLTEITFYRTTVNNEPQLL